jgi:hypothetical protein
MITAQNGHSRMRRPVADFGYGLYNRVGAQPHPGQCRPTGHERLADPQSAGHKEESEVAKITLDRLLIGTELLMKASELVRGDALGDRLGLVEIRAMSRHGLVTRASYRQARTHASETPRVARGATDRSKGRRRPSSRRALSKKAAGNAPSQVTAPFEATSRHG